MSAPALANVRFPVALTPGQPVFGIGLHPADSGVLVHIVGSDITNVVASWPLSGTLVGAAGAVTGYAGNDPTILAVGHIGFPRNQGSTKIRLSVDVEPGNNTFTVAGTTLTVWRFTAGVWAATAATVTYAALAVGIQNPVAFNVAFADGDLFDLQVTNPGNGADVGKTFSFGASVDFLLA